MIDLQGEINKQPCCLGYWDYKDGATYNIVYQNIEYLLKTKLELLRAKLYFPPPVNHPEYKNIIFGGKRNQI